MKAEIKNSFMDLKKKFSERPFPKYEGRLSLLKNLKRTLLKHETEIFSSISSDYGHRSSYDSLLGDFFPTIQHINYSIKNLRKWMKPERRSSGLALFPSQVRVYYQPLGVVGIIVPWNFPLFLSFGPMVSALAAGNKVILKLSELTPQMNKLLKKILKDFSDDIRLFEGDEEIGSFFSSLPFDHLFFTGSTKVGKLVGKSASENLTPVTLELGGKSPAIIGDDIPLEQAVENIIFGKSINAGQVCVAPDYVFLPKGKVDSFLKIYKRKFREYFLKGREDHYSCIINDQHYKRLQLYVEDAKKNGADIHLVKESCEKERKMYPHLMTKVKTSMLIMQEEIFGPILPILSYGNIEEVFSFLRNRPKPLALYLMSKDKHLQEKVLKNTLSGGVCFNDTIVHVGVEDAPFGGVGDSGLGQYHGPEGFLTFSKARTVLSTPAWIPRNKFLLKYRDLGHKIFRKFF